MLSGSGGQINSSITKISSSLSDFEASVVRFSSLIAKRMDDPHEAVAWECALAYCVNSYSTSVTDGEIQETIVQSWRNDSASYSQDSDLIYSPPDTLFDFKHENTTFKVASLAASSMNDFMSMTFSGSVLFSDPLA